MSSVRSPRASWPSRGRDREDSDAPPPAVRDLLARRGWAVVGNGEAAAPDGAGPRRWVVSDGSGRCRDVDLVHVPAEPAARAVLVERLDRLRQVDHEHLAHVEEVAEGDEGALVLISSRPTGVGLPLLRACRGPFEAGEAVTLLVPLAQALAALHASGLSYGGLGEPDVLLDAEGRAVLRMPLDLCAVPPADDVRSLGELVAGVLPLPAAATVPGGGAAEEPDPQLTALHAELATARRADPRTRPEVGTFAALCYEAASPSPIAMPDGSRLAAATIAARPGRESRRPERSPDGDLVRDDTVVRPPGESGRGAAAACVRPGGTPPRTRRAHGARRRRSPSGSRHHPALVAALVLVACSVLVAGVLLVGPHRAGEVAGPQTGLSPPGAERSDAPDSADPDPVLLDPTLQPDDPAGAAVELTERRVELLAGEREPSDVLAPGSPAEVSDADLLARVVGSGVVIDGATASVLEARPVAPDEDSTAAGPGAEPGRGTETQVDVTYAVSEHTQRTTDGTVTTVPATAASTARLTLRWTDVGWRVSAVV
ncbi:hypothetical protein [Oerskovia sp. KBS0722]|uniref:hypothetical protein n=1 Tax=Oerskovia sp. KBS0722 TaxID=1179673 RepID=UPI00110EB265|nr:hypothetical protein [Oerskovia sp. KBS0722]QDW63625.1 hypothetical protein FFI11_014910 [Oerskovia sp. KBS0722]